MGVNSNLTRRDVALGGKLRCPGCGGEWWVSGPQAEEMRAAGSWPVKCGNHHDVPVTGGRDDCHDENELVFVPYDVEENQLAFREAAVDHLLAAEAALAEAQTAEKAKDGSADERRAAAAMLRDAARRYADAADSLPEQAEEIVARAVAAEAREAASEELTERIDALDKEV